jgi:hypothetical protein
MRSVFHRFKAATLTFAVLIVLAASAFPPCAGASCCARADETAVEAPMECCPESSVSARDAVDSLAATSAPSPKAAPVAVIATTPASTIDAAVQAKLSVAVDEPDEPDPPLFLLHEQFRI